MSTPPDDSADPPLQPEGFLAIRTIAMPADTNPAGQIFGGWLMSQMDLAAGIHASIRAKGASATVAVDGFQFHAPVHVGDEVSCYTQLLRTGRTSMSIKVEAWVRRSGCSTKLKVTSGVFHFVAVDQDYKPRPLPPEDDRVRLELSS